MNATKKLAPADRDFFRLVAGATVHNPFSQERMDVDAKISGVATDAPAMERATRVIQTVAARVQQLEKNGAARPDQYEGEDRQMLQMAFLFHAFSEHIENFDRHIADQLHAGDDPLRVTFARDVMGLLAKRGHTSESVKHYLAVFFQVRRAYYFIDRSLRGRSRGMMEFRRRLWGNVFTHNIAWYESYLWDRMEDFSTLLLGETGTGKGAAAAAIGRSGYIPFDEKTGCFAESFAKTFTAINLSQFPESLIESELFGHRKGAFTGAIGEHEGVFARCSPYGSILIDEIGDAPAPVQIKLLNVLQDRTFSPVGSHEKLRFRGRVIAATNQPLDELRARGKFRDDFYYRLCSDVIHAPPLRERLAESPAELRDLLDDIVARLVGDESPNLVDQIVASLRQNPGKNYAWPGNVRELEQAARRILIAGLYEPRTPAATIGSDLARRIEAGDLDAESLLSAYCDLLYRRHGTYEEVARRTRLDRRTVRKYIHAHEQTQPVAGAGTHSEAAK